MSDIQAAFMSFGIACTIIIVVALGILTIGYFTELLDTIKSIEKKYTKLEGGCE